MRRSDGERKRLVQSFARLQGIIGCLETALAVGGPVGLEGAQALVMGATEIALQIAKLDAYDLAEDDARHRGSP